MPKFSISKTHRPLTTTLKRPLFRRRPPHPLSNREIIRLQSGRTTNDDRERTNAVRGLPVVTPPYTIMTGQRVRQSRSACATHTRRGGAREKRAERPFRGQIKHLERRAHCNIFECVFKRSVWEDVALFMPSTLQSSSFSYHFIVYNSIFHSSVDHQYGTIIVIFFLNATHF